MPPEVREVSLFRNNRNQAIRIPVEFELPGNRALIRKDGERLIIEPKRKAGLPGLLSSWDQIDDAVKDIADPVPDREDIL